MKLKLNKKQWEAMGKQAGWMGKQHIKTSSVIRLSSDQSMVAKFMDGLQSGSIKIHDVMIPMNIHPEISHMIFLLTKKGIDVKMLLEQSMSTAGKPEQQFKDQSLISFLYRSPEGKPLKEAILSIMKENSSSQQSEYSFRRNDPTNPIVI